MNIGEDVEVKFIGKVIAIELRDNKVLYTIQGDAKTYPRPFAAFVTEEHLTNLNEMLNDMEKQYEKKI